MSPPPQPTHYALLLIDIQRGFSHPTHWGLTRSTPSFEANVPRLLSAFRSTVPTANTKLSVIHVAHHSRDPTSALHPSNADNTAFHPYAAPLSTELVVTKHVNSAFIGTNLERELRERGVDVLVVAGLTTDHCVSTTVRMAANLGVVDREEGGEGQMRKGRILLVGDATATFERRKVAGFGGAGGEERGEGEGEGKDFDAETVHAVQLASLNGEFCEVVSTAAVLEELRVLARG